MLSVVMQDKKPIFKNRRYSPRWNLEGNCSYRIDDGPTVYLGYAKDVSCIGACITTDQSIVINQKINLTLPLPDGDVMKVTGSVAWTRQVNYKYEIGIRFFNASSEAQDMIVQYILNVDKDKMVNHWFEGWEGK